MSPSKSPRITRAKQKLAAGILLQARRDLRRFFDPETKVERELFFDAYSWVVSDSYSWPFSFRNVCRLLGRAPEELRQEILNEVSLGRVSYFSRRMGQAVRYFRFSVREALVPPGGQLAWS